jgi:hypothetical protein
MTEFLDSSLLPNHLPHVNLPMNFSRPFTDLQKIQLLQRSILVNSYCYYELNENILSDYQYDMNTRQLLELKKTNPEAYQKSRYRRYFNDFESGTGFDLTDRLRVNRKLYQNVARDAHLALRLKKNYEMEDH